MNAKEKAEQLKKDFTKLSRNSGLWRGCALRMIEEILKELPILEYHPLGSYANPKIEYWNEVLKEIDLI